MIFNEGYSWPNTDSFKQASAHEAGHALSLVVNSQATNAAFSAASFDSATNKWVFNGTKAKAQNGGNPVPLETKTGGARGTHFDPGVSALMQPFNGTTYTGPTALDLATLADHSYCVAGVNDTPSCP